MAYKVLLIADHKWRDLPGLAEVKILLEDLHGIQAYIVARRCFDTALAALRPHMVVLNSINGEDQRYVARTTKRMGGLVAVLPTEGRPQDNDLMKYVTGQFSDLSCVDLWLNWSETVNDVMLEKGVISEKKAHVTGSPRFDFYVPPLRDLLTPKQAFLERHGLDLHRPTVSWATNFVLARHVRTRTEDFLEKDFKNLGVAKLSTYGDPTGLAKMDLEVRLEVLQVIHSLCGRFPHVNFLLKPHPFEDVEDYAALVARCRADGMTNIALVTEQYIWDVLNAVDVHIHRLCTTGIEAWLMGVPSISFHTKDYGGWNLNCDGPSKEALAGEDHISDEKALVERLAYYLSGGQVPARLKEAQESYLRRWFYKIDGMSGRRCAQAIADALHRAQPVPAFRLWHLNRRGIAKVALNWVRGRQYDEPVRQLKRTASGIPVDFLGQRDKAVSRQDVEFWSGRIRTVLTTRNE